MSAHAAISARVIIVTILAAIPETACQSDSAALDNVIDELKQQGFLPHRYWPIPLTEVMRIIAIVARKGLA